MIKDDPGKLEERFFVETDTVDIRKCDTAVLDTVIDGLDGKCRRVLPAGAALFLDRHNRHAILVQTGGGIVIMTGYSQYIHGSDCAYFTNTLNPGINERCDNGRAHVARQENEQRQNDEDGKQKSELVFLYQVKHLFENIPDLVHLAPLMA